MSLLPRMIVAIDRTNDVLGRAVAWLAVVMVVVQVVVVLLRYVFGIGIIWMQESIVYMHALIFMVGAGYTLLHGGHVRVDVFYREASERRKALVDLLGSVLFALPVCILVIMVSRGYVANSWAVLEGSKETSGIQAVFLLKSIIIVFAVLVGLQALSMAARSVLTLTGKPQPPSPATTPEAAQ